MTLKQRYDAILGYFRDNVPIAESELHFDSPYQLLVAVILSAQCTDKRVNMTTPALFSAYPTPEALAEAFTEEILERVDALHGTALPLDGHFHVDDRLDGGLGGVGKIGVIRICQIDSTILHTAILARDTDGAQVLFIGLHDAIGGQSTGEDGKQNG